ncbi:MAG: hypothetical protein ABL962_21905 [Fimbriimonadaceae bacterium]
MVYRPEFREALDLLAKAIAEVTGQGVEPPILVGGGAVELYTGSEVVSGDFDFVTPHQRAFEDAFERAGFRRVMESGFLTRSLIHRLGFGVQIVSGLLMDGKASLERIRVFEIVDGAKLWVIPAEDLIADRMGQAYSDTPPRGDMLDQAFGLMHLVSEIDESYLDRRICEETAGGANLATLKRWTP